MEIHNQTIQTQPNTNHHLPLREGEVYGAKVQERVSANEAILSIRGQEVMAKFSGKVPSTDRIHVQIEGKGEDHIRVRTIGDSNSGTHFNRDTSHLVKNEIDHVMKNLGLRDTTPVLKEAVAKFIHRNIPLTKDTAQQLRHFIEKGDNSLQQRLATVDVVAKKGLEPTTENLRVIHEALHGKKLTEQIRKISGEKLLSQEKISRSDNITNRSTHIDGKANWNSKQAGNDELSTHVHDKGKNTVSREIVRELQNILANLNNYKSLRQSITQIQRALSQEENGALRSTVIHVLRDVLELQGQNETSRARAILTELIGKLDKPGQSVQSSHQTATPFVSVIEEWKGLIQNEANLLNGMEKLQQILNNEQLPENVVQLISEGMDKASHRLEQGRELKAREEILTALQHAQEQMPQTGGQNVQVDAKQEMLHYVANEILQTSAINSKSILITEITERLAKATDEFKTFQREVSHQLSRIQILIEQFRAQSTQQTKPMLDKVIQQLDRALLKSDWLLFADMKTEKTVLKASSQLAEARNLLARGDHVKARQIVGEVQQTLDRLNFKPVKQKVQHFLSIEQKWQENRPKTYRLSQQYEHVARSLTHNEGSSRQILEGLRGLGLNREAELAQTLVNKGQISEEHGRDLKSLLLRLSRGEEDGTKLQQQAQQTVQNITGQQLLGRMDHQQNMQMLLFQLPVLLKGQGENLQVFVNARNENEKLDWENCRLYFLIETKKLGELGIDINVVDRALTVTLKNDSAYFENKVKPIAKKYLDRIEEIGFSVNGLKFSKLTTEPVRKKEKQQEQLVPTMTKKGFDYKI